MVDAGTQGHLGVKQRFSRARRCALSLVTIFGMVPAAFANTPDAVFTSLGGDVGLNDLMTREGVAGWFDVDLDGRPDPVWVSDQQIITTDVSAPAPPTDSPLIQ